MKTNIISQILFSISKDNIFYRILKTIQLVIGSNPITVFVSQNLYVAKKFKRCRSKHFITTYFTVSSWLPCLNVGTNLFRRIKGSLLVLWYLCSRPKIFPHHGFVTVIENVALPLGFQIWPQIAPKFNPRSLLCFQNRIENVVFDYLQKFWEPKIFRGEQLWKITMKCHIFGGERYLM